MNPLKRLAGQTAIYGLPTIVGRLLNYFLVPLYTRVFSTDEYGVVTELYAYVAFLMVILTYGMETAFFRFSQKNDNKEEVFQTTALSLIISSTLFIVITILFAFPISKSLGYDSNTNYIVWFALILGADAISSIPFARLRVQNKAKRFALIKTVNISLQIVLNLFFILLCPWLKDTVNNQFILNFIQLIYSPEIGVGYIFISNLIASVVTFFLLSPELSTVNWKLNKVLWKQMFFYAFPIMIWGMAGIVNETFDRILLKHLIPISANPMSQLGIYGACYKVSIIMTLFIQTFKFAAEPFFFAQEGKKDSKQIYADVMKYFVIICALIFVVVMVFIDWVILFVGKDFRIGIGVIPILLLANMFLGIFYNLSIWYKLTDQTRFGAYISIFGAIVTLVLNFLLVPIYGYMGAAWATFACYLSIMIISYFLGQKYYRINYQIVRILFYIIFALLIYFASIITKSNVTHLQVIINLFWIGLYVSTVLLIEKKDIKKLKSNQ